ncbi:THAP domain-containing protein 5-like isoform X3 [Periplaneta americana]|uniref:THAP domain-containing protein 5-like isoform X3 n=1 Tax=Periplaneta americana TaxID=6978 RepID=UPI0037E7BF0F
MVNCCVPLCKSRQGSSHSKGIKYYEIPSAKELREKWLASISREGACKGSTWVPSDYSRVCSLHFRSEDYRENCKKQFLKPGVIPSIFPAYPSYLQSRKITSRKKRATSVNKESEVELCGNSVQMDLIKMEPDINPLPMQLSDTEEKKPLSEEGNLLDLPVTRIKEECVDDSYNHNPEIKFEEIILPNNFPVMKCEPEEETFVMSPIKEESMLEVTTEESEVLTERTGCLFNLYLPMSLSSETGSTLQLQKRCRICCIECGKKLTSGGMFAG